MSFIPLVLLASVSHAEPLAWAWSPGQVVNYHAEITRERDDGDWHQAIVNLEARAHQTNLAVDMSCGVTDELKKGWLVECSFHNVSISGIAMGDEQPKLNAIFDEYEANLEQASAVFELTSLGRIKAFDIRPAFEPANERQGQVVDAMRMLMVRPFALLELELPKAGDDHGKAWKQGGSPLLTQLRSSYGTAGAVIIKHSVESRDGGMVSIATEGRGTVAYGLAVESDGTKTIAVDLAGGAEFDQEQGVLARREAMVVGRFTAGAAYSNPTDHFREVLVLERIEAISTPSATEPSPKPAPEPEPSPEPAVPAEG
jgi:hypothetical protein